MSSIVFQGQRLTIGFLVLCWVLAVFNVLRGLANAGQVGLLFALAQKVFCAFQRSSRLEYLSIEEGGLLSRMERCASLVWKSGQYTGAGLVGLR
jgi:hypothetical protein